MTFVATMTPLEQQLDQIETGVAEVCGQLNAAHARLVRLVAEVLEADRWAVPGIMTPTHWVQWQTGCNRSRARTLLHIARRVDELPACMRLFDTGALSLDQMAVITARCPTRHDREMAELAPELSVAQIRHIARRWHRPADPPPPPPPRDDEADSGDDRDHGDSGDSGHNPDSGNQASDDAASENPFRDNPFRDDAASDNPFRDDAASDSDDADGDDGVGDSDHDDGDRSDGSGSRTGTAAPPPTDPAPVDPATAEGTASWWFDDHGRFHLHLEAPMLDGLLLEAALAEARDALFLAGDTKATDYDAVIEIAQRSLTAVGTADRSDRSDRFRIYAFMDTEGAWLSSGMRVPDALLDQILSNGVVRPVWTTGGVPVNVGRGARTVSNHVRRLVHERDGGRCRTPACTNTVGLDVHHYRWWRHGGGTDLHNLGLHCSRCHAAIHRGDIIATGDPNLPAHHPNALRFQRADGTSMSAVRPPVPPTAPPPPGRWVRPTHGRLDERWIHFHDDDGTGPPSPPSPPAPPSTRSTPSPLSPPSPRSTSSPPSPPSPPSATPSPKSPPPPTWN
jgi:hypothetical protein